MLARKASTSRSPFGIYSPYPCDDIYCIVSPLQCTLIHRRPSVARPPRRRLQNRWYTTPFNYTSNGVHVGTSFSFLTVFRSLQRRGVSRALYLVSVVKSYQDQESLAINYLSLSFLSFSLSPFSFPVLPAQFQSSWRDKVHRSYPAG